MNALKSFSNSELYAEICQRRGDLINFGKSQLKIDCSMGGGIYQTDNAWSEFHHPVYEEIRNLIAPQLIVDIGANIGFSSVCFAENFPETDIIAIEPNASLASLYKKNMEINSIKCYELKNIAMGDSAEDVGFLECPGFSVDGRVASGDDTPSYAVSQNTLSGLLSKFPDDKSVFIKIDTQGYDFKVLQGGEEFFKRNHNFLVRTEFAPAWIDKVDAQGSHAFLTYLVENFDVIELSPPTFHNTSLADRFKTPLTPQDIAPFDAYVRKRANFGKGYVDLLIKSKSKKISL